MRRLKLSTSLIASFALASALPIVVLTLILLLFETNQSKKVTEQQSQLTATTVAHEVEHVLVEPETILNQIAVYLENETLPPEAIDGFLNIALRQSRNFESIELIDATGRILNLGLSEEIEQRRQDFLGMDLSRRPFIARVLQSDDPLWSDAFFSMVTGRISMALALPAGDRFLVANFNIDDLKEIPALRQSQANGLVTAIIDRNGTVLFHPDKSVVDQHHSMLNLEPVRRFLDDGTEGNFRYELDGEWYLGSVFGVPRLDWLILVSQPIHEAYATVRQIQMLALGVMIVSLLLVMLWGTSVARRTTAPLENLAERAAAISAGDHEKPLPMQRHAETDRVASTLWEMVLAVREREQQYRDLVDNIPGPVYWCENDENWSVHFISDAIHDLVGLPPSYFTEEGHTFAEIIHPEDLPRVRREVDEALEVGDAFTLEYRMVHRNGDTRWVHERGLAVRDADGTIVSLNGAIFDITERRRAWAENERLSEQLRQAQKMEAIGQLAGGVAHDFNNLLLTIIGNIEFAMEETSATSAVHEDLTQIKNAAERAAGLTRQLLAFSRRQMLMPEPLDLNVVITDLVKLLRRLIGENITLDLVEAPDLMPIHADRGQIEQVIMNLVVNARDAMERGGVITIVTKNVDLTEADCRTATWTSPGPHVRVTVADTGVGMDQDTMERIFEPFFTTKGVGKGTGLGLATVYGIVRQHHGMITVNSEVGRGTVFTLTLPTTEIDVSAEPERGAITPVNRGSESILLVEDDPGVRGVTTRALRGAGYRVTEASDGQEAVEIFEKQGEEVDLLVLDLVMPNMSGVEAHRAIEKIRPGVPVIFCSGHSGEEMRPEGNHPMLTKPHSRTELLRTVRMVLDGVTAPDR